MSEQQIDSSRISRMEATQAETKAAVSSIASSVESLAKTVGIVAEKTDSLTSHVARLEAGQGRIPLGTIIGLTSTFIALLGVSLTAVIVVGSMALQPVRESVEELQATRQTTVEQLLPSLSSDLADLRARVNESETELNLVWEDPNIGLFPLAIERGRMLERTERHERLLLDRHSDSDDAQDARIEAIFRELEELRRYLYSDESENTGAE